MNSTRKIIVKSNSRIHLGFTVFKTSTYSYGGIGIALSNPNYVIEFSLSGNNEVSGCQAQRVNEIKSRISRVLGTDIVEKYSVRIRSCIPVNKGFGSTTQLTLSLIYGYLAANLITVRGKQISIKAMGDLKKKVIELGFKLGRGVLSGVGIGVFDKGGFIIDYGIKTRGLRPYTCVKAPFNWRIVLIVPKTNRQAIKDSVEEVLMLKNYFARLAEESDTLLLNELALKAVFSKIIPALLSRDYMVFVEGIEDVEKANALFFSAAQGGSGYCCPESETVASILYRYGCRGIGQSSWGPLIYCFPPPNAVLRLDRIIESIESSGVSVEYASIARISNRGARIFSF